MSDSSTLQFSYPGGVANTRRVNKGLRELAQKGGMLWQEWIESSVGLKIYCWEFDTPSKKAAKALARDIYLIFARGCNRGAECTTAADKIDRMLFFIDDEKFKVPKKWQNEAFGHLKFDAYQNAGGTMDRENFDKECQEPGGLERVFVEEGLKRDWVVMGRLWESTSAPFDFFP